MRSDKTISSYYPPRARWWSPFLMWGFSIRRVLHLDRIHLPGSLSMRGFILSLVLPGYALTALGRAALGRGFQLAYWISVVLFAIALGYPVGNFAYGIMVGAHATGIVYLQSCWLRDVCGFGLRLVLAFLTLVILWSSVYDPVIHFVERHWCLPLRVRDHVVVVNPTARPRLAKGEWVMYKLEGGRIGDGHGEGAVMVLGGYGWGPVLGAAGDRVIFSTNGFTIDGVLLPRRLNMPSSGDFVVPEKHWFVWPEFDMGGRGNVNSRLITERMIQMGTVSEDRVVGRPYGHWFFRRQTF